VEGPAGRFVGQRRILHRLELMPTRPVVDHGRCEAKRDCVRVCPYDVFEVRRMDPDDFTTLGLLGKLRTTAHRRMTAYPVNADQCHECGLCVAACPEDAITLL
jgi:4Fe-4S ferredoxin